MLAASTNAPWVIAANFNSVLAFENRVRGNPTTATETLDFQSYITGARLQEIRHVGSGK